MAVYRKHSGGIHTSLSSVQQVLNAIKSLHIIGENLQVTHLDSFRQGLRFRREQFLEILKGNEIKIAHLQKEIELFQKTLSGVRNSKTFRFGRSLSRWRDNLKRRLSGS